MVITPLERLQVPPFTAEFHCFATALDAFDPNTRVAGKIIIFFRRYGGRPTTRRARGCDDRRRGPNWVRTIARARTTVNQSKSKFFRAPSRLFFSFFLITSLRADYYSDTPKSFELLWKRK